MKSPLRCRRFLGLASLMLVGLLMAGPPAYGHEPHQGSATDHGSAATTWLPELESLFAEREGGLFAGLLGLAFLSGALHALLPGHGKTLVAAYLVGERGTAWDALLLGLSTALSHTAVVLGAALLLVGLGQTAAGGDLLNPYFSLASGLIVVGLGAWLLRRHLADGSELAGHPPGCGCGHHHHHDADDLRDEAHAPHHHVTDEGLAEVGSHLQDAALEETAAAGPTLAVVELAPPRPAAAARTLPEARPSRATTLVLGITGGLVPCPDAVAMLLVGFALGEMIDGLWLLVAFSLGLACTLVMIGLSVVKLGRSVAPPTWAQPLVRRLPLAAAVLILGLGLGMTGWAGWGLVAG